MHNVSESVLLTADQMDAEFKTLNGGTLTDDRKAITKFFVFADLVQAFGFMSSVALFAEKPDHHADRRMISAWR